MSSILNGTINVSMNKNLKFSMGKLVRYLNKYRFFLIGFIQKKLKSCSRRNYVIALIMMSLPLLVLGPVLFQRGYLIQYDMVFSPYVHLNLEAIRDGAGLYQGLPMIALLKFISFVFPMDIVQNLLLYSIFFLGFLSIYRGIPVRSAPARLLAGLMYMVNPFTYDRLMAGHWRILLAYSLTPFVLRSFLRIYTSPSGRQLLRTGLLLTLVIAISAHHLLILGLLFLCLAPFFIRTMRELWYSLGLIGLTGLLNTWWIIPTLYMPNYTNSFNLDHFYAFRTALDMAHGIWFNMLTLQGFWFTDWRSIKDFTSLWPLLALLWLTIPIAGIAGIFTYVQKYRRLIFGLLLAGAASLFFAAGPHPSVWQINVWLFENMPGFSGMREPQKFLSLLALAYSVLAAFGMDMLFSKLSRKAAAVVASAAIIVLLLIGSPLLWGAQGSMDPVDYPDSWHEFNEILRSDKDRPKAIVLPWELYTYNTFAEKLVANPARSFYGDQVIQSQRMNIPGVYDVEPPELKAVNHAVRNSNVMQLKSAMDTLNARYILITDVQPRPEYNWLIQGNAFKAVVDSQELMVLKIDK